MKPDLLQRAADLTRKGEPFVVAVVVRREPASSAQVGNMAIVTEGGVFHGWLGGSCIQPTVVREALAALVDGCPRLIAITPDADAARRAGISVFPMTCHSGGSVDIYVEPVLPAPRVLVYGVAPVAQALVRLGKAMGYAVEVVDPDADRSTFPEADDVVTDLQGAARGASPAARRFAVIATFDRHDAEAALAALAAEADYVAVVASRRRFAEIREALVARGAPADRLARIRNPAGLDIGAKAPEEVALSILAEIVQVRRAGIATRAEMAAPPAAVEERDPVCGMTVSASTSRHRAEHHGQTFFFCCGGCRDRFVADPDRYLTAKA